MVIEKRIITAGQLLTAVISDEREALLAADAAGRAAIGIWRPGREMPAVCLYLVEDPEDVTEKLLVRAVRRKLGLPWEIAETKRLLIREFCDKDPLEEPSPWDCGVFSDQEARRAYIANQYRFSECGLWALEEKQSGKIIGKAGITGDELGYHIYPEFRRQGFALEACSAILDYAREELELREVRLVVSPKNQASARLADRLGFAPEEKGSGQGMYERRIAFSRG